MPAWTEAGAGNPPGDRRTLGSVGPFTFSPGQEEELVVAYVYARAASGGPEASLEALRVRTDSIRAFAASVPGLLLDGVHECFNASVSVAERSAASDGLQVFPNPVGDALTVRMSDGIMNALVSVLDARGTLVRQQRLAGSTAVLDVSGLVPGLHVLRVQAQGQVRSTRFIKE